MNKPKQKERKPIEYLYVLLYDVTLFLFVAFMVIRVSPWFAVCLLMAQYISDE